MNIWLLSKAVALFGIAFFVIPVVFVLFLGLWGNHFSLAIAKDSWVAKSNSRLVRLLFSRFLI